MSDNKTKILQISEVARSRFFRVESVDLLFSNGEQRTYERLANRSNGAVIIIALTTDNQFLLVREYAVGMERYELTLPKGKIDDNESAIEAAGRELIEECGYRAAKLTLLHSLSLASGYSTHMSHIVLAEDLTPASSDDGDEPEPLEIIPWALDNTAALLNEPECSEARTFAALYICQQYLSKRQQEQNA